MVDLRGVGQEELDSDWTPEAVEPLARMLSDLGDSVEETCALVEEAKGNVVGIRNDSALRYEVPPAVWQAGVGISQWVASVHDSLANAARNEV